MNDIMRAAGMTHGGFYRHFDGKDDLLAAALAEAFARFAPTTGETDFRDRYLSPDHVSTPAEGCPAAALGPEVARAGPTARAAFAAGLEQVIAGLAPDAGARADALRDFSLMVGAVILARASGGPLADEILAAAQTAK